MIVVDECLKVSKDSQTKEINKLKLILELRRIGFGANHKGTWRIVDLISFCHSKGVVEIDSLEGLYKEYTKYANIRYTDRFKWNIQDSIDYMEENPYKDKSLLCSIFIEYKYYETCSVLKFLNALLDYVELNIDKYT